MVTIPAGPFLMGCDRNEGQPGDGEEPAREVHVDAFCIGATAVTNREFAAFADATGHVTDAERFGWSYVFWLAVPRAARDHVIAARIDAAPWWRAVRGACWRRPEGPGSSVEGRADHPAVHVSWNDARACADWSGARLPTEAEWEKAARGGLRGARYPWGDEMTPGGRHMMNVWQGDFPRTNTAGDGHLITAPAASFPPNGFGLYNMTGNVWEWTADRWDAGRSPGLDADGGGWRVIRGGSYLCHASWCNRYRNAARSGNEPDASTAHMGFRLAR